MPTSLPPELEALSATFVPKWKTANAYLAGTQVQAPTGEIVTARADHTSGVSFTAANWNFPTSSRSGLVAQNVAGTVTVPVTSGFTYELTATANAVVSLAGALGSQVAIVAAPGAFSLNVSRTVTTAKTFVAHLITSGWGLYPIGAGATGDFTAPTASTLGVSVGETAGATYNYTGLTAATSYTFRHQVQDAALNTKLGDAVTISTTATPVWSDFLMDDFTALADGTAISGRTTETGR